MISSMKLLIAISITIGFASVLTWVIYAGPITQKAYAAVNPTSSSASGGSLGQSKGLGGANEATTGADTAAQSGGVDRDLFCKTGVITPICK
jgi:hypothetical protein